MDEPNPNEPPTQRVEVPFAFERAVDPWASTKFWLSLSERSARGAIRDGERYNRGVSTLPLAGVLLVLVVSAIGGGGCASREAGLATRTGGPRAEGRLATGEGSGRPAAIVDGAPCSWLELQPWLAEASGGAVLQELAIDRRLQREFEGRGLTLAAAALTQEQANLARSLSLSAGRGPDDGEVLVQRLRRERGLGEQRFAALLRRSAMLRQLVQAEVVVDEESLKRAWAARFGKRIRTRVIIVTTHSQASALLAQLAGAGADLPARFSRLAMESSTDESAARGGVLPAWSPEDPNIPLLLRQAGAGTAPGELSQILALDTGFGLLLVEGVVPETGRTLAEARSELEFEVRLRQERLLMDRLAAKMLQEAQVAPQDRALDWSWRATRRPE